MNDKIKDLMKELNANWANGDIEDMPYIQTLNNLMQAILVTEKK